MLEAEADIVVENPADQLPVAAAAAIAAAAAAFDIHEDSAPPPYDSIINKEMTIAALPPFTLFYFFLYFFTSSISDVPASGSLGAIPNISTSSRRRNISVHNSEGSSVYS